MVVNIIKNYLFTFIFKLLTHVQMLKENVNVSFSHLLDYSLS